MLSFKILHRDIITLGSLKKGKTSLETGSYTFSSSSSIIGDGLLTYAILTPLYLRGGTF
jgi:hypothetical protein